MGLFSKTNKTMNSQSLNANSSNSAINNCNANSQSYTTTGYINTASPFAIGSGYATGNYSTAWGISNDFFDEGEIFKSFISYLNEEEIKDFLEKIASRNIDTDSFNKTIRSIVRNRHMSEDFLLDHFEKLALEEIYRFHKADIKSQEYTRIALLIETAEKR